MDLRFYSDFDILEKERVIAQFILGSKFNFIS